jgi:xylan 1,4-beta-xylosidase
MSKSEDTSPFNRRNFLKTGLAASVAASTMSAAAAWEGSPPALPAAAGSETARPSIIQVTSTRSASPLRKPWQNCIAVDLPSTLLRADLQNHLAKLRREIGYRHIRAYAFLHEDMAMVARREDGSLAFRWEQADKALDMLIETRLRPFLNLSPMPVALASGATTVFDWVNATPPRDYAEWGQFMGAFARHCLDRYGLEEIAQWYFEVWNEPNINFWTGTQQGYWKLYDVSAKALKAVNPRLRVGGPVSARCEWIGEMIAHCTNSGVPLDFISTHIYPQDEWVLYPGLRGSPHQPGKFVSDMVRKVRETVRQSAMPGLETHLTEWASMVPLPDGQILWDKNPSLDDLCAAATACDLALAVDEDCDTFCWWTASDIVEQGGMPQSEFCGTWGLLTSGSLPKASFNAFRFLSRLRGSRLEVQHETLPPGCGLVATSEGERLRVLLWFRDLSIYGTGVPQPWACTLQLPWTDATKPLLIEERIAAHAGSCYETWQSLGAPQSLSPTEFNLLKAHSVPEMWLFKPEAQGGRITHEFRLMPGEVLLCELGPQGAAALPKTPLREEVATWYAVHGENQNEERLYPEL